MQLHSPSDVIRRVRLFREWERTNLPVYGSLAGYELFLILASSPYSDKMSLKEVYLSMRCAESTTRLLFRNLESDGWIVLPRDPTDNRFKEFQLTEKFRSTTSQWLELFVSSVHVQDCLSEFSSNNSVTPQFPHRTIGNLD